jgi:uncharacterized protein (TIGR03435 family)
MRPNLYQIDATMPSDTTRVEFQLMMQDFLKERFRLRIHSEKRNFPGYELAVAKAEIDGIEAQSERHRS